MKKIVFIFLCLVSLVGLVSCDTLTHEHTYIYTADGEAGHYTTYTCGCNSEEGTSPHYDEDNDGTCDACEYYIGVAHKYHDYYFDMNEDSHMKVFTCGCVSDGFEPHYNNDSDEYCDECGWNMVSHEHAHEHTYEDYYDEIGHGWNYSCGCDTPPNFTQHFDGNNDGKCDGCDYMVRKYGLIYEKSRDEYSVIGFIGDEDGIVEIPDTYNGLPVRQIRGNAFYGQDVIVEIIIGNNVLAIEGNAFMKCENLKKVTIGEKVEVIDQQAFMKCYELEEITIPASVTFIGNSVFRDCTKLKSIIFENPNGWCITSNLHKPFPAEDMSNIEIVIKYFTETYVGSGWRRI